MPAVLGAVDALRALQVNSGGDIAIVLAVAAALTAVFAPLTTRLYRRR